jgi:hypothetical protein
MSRPTVALTESPETVARMRLVERDRRAGVADRGIGAMRVDMS